MVKILVGLPGDHVEVTSDRTTVNDVVVATGLHLAERLGQRPEAFARSFTLCPKATISGWANPTIASTAGISG